MEKKVIFVPFETRCAWCNKQILVEFQHMSLGPRELEMYERDGCVRSHGCCPECAEAELRKAMEEVKHA